MVGSALETGLVRSLH